MGSREDRQLDYNLEGMYEHMEHERQKKLGVLVLVTCFHCNGSGEGIVDGSICPTCKGKGELEIKDDVEEE